MFKGITRLAALALATTQVFAINTNISHITADAGVKFNVIKLATKPSFTMPSRKPHNLNYDQIIVEGDIHKISGVSATELMIPAYSRINIYNGSQTAHRYNIEISICAVYPDQQATKCASAQEQIHLKPAESIQLQRRPEFTFIFDRAGTYTSFVETYVSRDDQPTLFSNVTSAEVNIIDSK